jgi:4-amino-4-deoxy-L-arabinose transferase-like glycosyltransferase
MIKLPVVSWRVTGRPSPIIALLALLLLFLAVNARWVWLYRHGLALDIDESGYLSYALIDYYGLHYGGLSGWVAAIEMPSIQAPLTMLLASLLFCLAGPHIILGFAVPLAAATACIAVAYAVGRSVGPAWVALVAALLTASCPVIINYARSYQFSMLATLLTTLALLAILRSRRMYSVGWALVFGICLGLMPLARTMTIAFVPGLVAAAAAAVLVEKQQRLRRLLMLAGSMMLGALVAASWLWRNGVLVAQYLLGYGYGAHALAYGPKISKLGVDAWLWTVQGFIDDIYYPHFLILLLGGLAACGVVSRVILWHGPVTAVRRVFQSPLLPMVIFIAEVMIVITTSSNKGSGFYAPVVPACLVFTAWALYRLDESHLSRTFFLAPTVAVAIVAAIPLVDLHTRFAPEWAMEAPIIGGVTVTDGRGTIQRDEANVYYGPLHAVEPIDNATSRAWVSLSSWTATELTKGFGQQAVILFGFRNALYNVNTLNLQELLRVRSAFAVRQVDPVVTGESVAGYLSWLQGDGAQACALLTSDRLDGDFSPAINRSSMEQAARQAGFVPQRQWPAPDGENIVLWTRPTMPANCHVPRRGPN